MAQTLYDKYGGFSTVSRIVLDFYERALDSDQIGDYFEGVDLAKLIDHQTKFVSSLLGGPASYSNDHLRQIHIDLRIGDEDFTEMAEVLSETLIDHGMSRDDASIVVNEIEARRAFIVA